MVLVRASWLHRNMVNKQKENPHAAEEIIWTERKQESSRETLVFV